MKFHKFSQEKEHLSALFQDIILQLIKHHMQSAIYSTSIMK